MAKYILFLILSLAYSVSGFYEHMTDVMILCSVASFFFALKIWTKHTRKVRRSYYLQKVPVNQ